MSIVNKPIATPQPASYQRQVPASDVTEQQNRTEQFTPQDGTAAQEAKLRMSNIWLLEKKTIKRLVSEEQGWIEQVEFLDAEAGKAEQHAKEREGLAQARERAWARYSRNLSRTMRRLGPAALLGTFLLEFVLALVAWVAMVGNLETQTFVDVALKPGPLISAAGLALVTAITVLLAGTGLAEYLERRRLEHETKPSPSSLFASTAASQTKED